MNIGSLFKSMMGDAKPGELKQLDLREGQVVRGVVQSVSDDGKEAVVQIQGVKVNAKLETPLQAGQTAFMQVQPAAEDGSVVMKPVSAPSGNTGAQSIEDTLKQVGLPDTKPNRELIRMMQQAEIPVTREQTAEVRSLLAQKPANVNAQEWIRSISVLEQRGLPLTPQSVAGMQQAIFGPPASTLLQNLEQQVALALAQLGADSEEQGTVPGKAQTALSTGVQNNPPSGSAAASGANPAAAAAGSNGAPIPASSGGQTAGAGQTGASGTGLAGSAAAAGAGTANGSESTDLAQNAGLSAVRTAAGQAGASAQSASQSADAASRQSTIPNGGGKSDSPEAALLRKVQTLLSELRSAAANGTDAAGSAASAASGPAQPEGAEAAPWVGRMLKMLGAEHEQQTARATLLNAAPAPSAAQQQSSGTPQTAGQVPQPPGANAAPQAASQTAPQSGAASTPSAAASAAAGNPAAAEQAAAAAPDGESRPGLSSAVRAAADQALRAIRGEEFRPEAATTSAAADGKAAQPPAQHAAAEIRETLKSLLLQLSSSDSLPAGVKDAAQQAVQQLTGQQLLLNTDRTAPFAQVTMFLPFVGPDGNQTASVQIESKRGAKGELDASNCRLWFDLDMKALGRTVIDVQVVDRKVSLNFRNDEEWARPLLEAGQSEIASALSSAGYQLMALRTDALPQRSETASGETNASLSYVPQSYRGVDVKI